MAIKQLTEEQIRTWSLKQKDEWWLKNVYKGNMRQLTLRSALTGAFLGAVLSMTNLYVGIKTGWTLGVGITSVILSFAAFKIFSKFNLSNEMTILENNAMQSIATSAGYMTSPLISAIAGYMMVTGIIPPAWQITCWIIVLGLLGVLFAFPLKKRAINDENLPFPEGYAAGVVLDNLHHADPKEGIVKAKLLMGGAAISAMIEVLRSGAIMNAISAPFLALPHYWDEFVYKFYTPAILGTPLKDLTIRMDSSIVLFGSGTLLSMKTATSMLIGGILNYGILAPIMIQKGVITGVGFRNISIWSLWGGAAMMTTASLYSFFTAESTIESFREFLRPKNKKKEKADVLKEIELPFSVSLIGVPIITVVMAIMGKAFFDIDYWLSFASIPLVFVLSIMAVKSTGMTGITPGSALAKMTQVVFAVLAPGNMGTNLITAGISSTVTLGASNLLMDIKPAHMHGGKPRQMAIGHTIGIFAGGIVVVPIFYIIFRGDINLFGTDQFPLPSAIVWKAVAEVLSKGLASLHPTAQVAVLIGAILGVALEALIQKTKGKFPLSPIGLGLPFVFAFPDTLMMFLGAFSFWVLKKIKPENKRSERYHTFVENQETIGAGIIAGGSIVGILILIFEATVG